MIRPALLLICLESKCLRYIVQTPVPRPKNGMWREPGVSQTCDTNLPHEWWIRGIQRR
jgi:hypothetical protein